MQKRAISMKHTFCLLAVLLLWQGALAQGVQITLGPDEVAENQGWSITLTVQNDRLKSYDNFPDLDGFRKRGTSTQSSTSIINGQVSSSQSVIMTYVPIKQGVINVPAFTMKVNDKPVSVAGKKVKVGPAAQQQPDPYRSIFDRNASDDFFGRRETEFVDVKEDAFLALTTNKDDVYVGEGFNTTLSFFVSESNRAPLQFHELGKQLSEILKKIKPTNCWEENFNIENIEAERVTLPNGKTYDQYKIYQATFYPFNAEPIRFPAIGLKMIKFKVAKNPSFFGQNRQEDFKMFYSKPKEIKVKELPPHPLKDVVSVGNYRLDEKLRSKTLATGQSVGYEFNIFGEGNISGIAKPPVKGDASFEFYEPNVRQNISRANNRVTGTKSFNYFLIPKEPGDYKLGDYFRWVYFNPEKKRYDTLRSQLTVNVTGESKRNEAIQSSSDAGGFYDQLTSTDNSLRNLSGSGWQKWAFNGFLLVMLAASAYLVVRK